MIVNATAAAATISTAVAAVSTVMHVASLVTNWSRRALKAGCRAGMVGIAGREPTDIGWLSLNAKANRTSSRRPVLVSSVSDRADSPRPPDGLVLGAHQRLTTERGLGRE